MEVKDFRRSAREAVRGKWKLALPLFLLARGINPFRTLGRMMPAVLMALFTKDVMSTSLVLIVPTTTLIL